MKKILKLDQKKKKKTYKTHKYLFEKIKKHAKKNYYRDKVEFFENDIHNTQKIIKEIIGKNKNLTMKRCLNI